MNEHTPFPLFQNEFPPSGVRIQYNPLQYDHLAAILPEALVQEWITFGFGPYGNGLIWTLPPDEAILRATNWLAVEKSGIEVLRTAFGDFCIFQDGQFVWLNVLSGKTFNFGQNAHILFDSAMIEKYFRKSILLESTFKYALKNLGSIDSDECYGFAPLPSLGGAIDKKYLIKTKMREYLSLLYQVNH